MRAAPPRFPPDPFYDRPTWADRITTGIRIRALTTLGRACEQGADPEALCWVQAMAPGA